jgi:hypothetical protein
MQLSIEPEFRLMAACCRPIKQAGRDDAIRAAAREPFDADRLLALAHAHRVEGFVEQGLAQAGVALPKLGSDKLIERARVARLQMLRNAGEEVRLSGLFRDAGIDHVFVKGATLAILAHGSLANKSSWDIDLLVNHGDVEAAISVLRDARYEFDHPEIAKAGLARCFALRYRESSWTNAERAATVELHWALTHNPTLLTAVGMLSDRQNVLVGANQPLPTLATPDLFSFLVVHGTAHGWRRLKWLADVAALLENTPLSVNRLLEHARSVDAGRCAAVALLLMRDLFGLSLPNSFNAEVAGDQQVQRLTNFSLQQMLILASTDGTPNLALSHWWAEHTAQMAMGPGFKHALADIWAKLNQPMVPRRLRLPRWLLVPDALFIWLPFGLLRRLVRALYTVRSGNLANRP